MGFPGGSVSKESAAMWEIHVWSLGQGRSPGEWLATAVFLPGGAWQVTIHGMQRVWHNWVSDWHN